MVKKCSKNKSKRQTCRQKFKIEKKVAEHHRKVRKVQRKKDASGVGKRRRAQKEVLVPREAPFRDQVLAEAEAARVETDARKAAARQALRDKKRSLTDIASDAQRATDAWTQKQRLNPLEAASVVPSSDPQERSAKAFHRELEKVLAECDVLLQVLDARDPAGTRCAEIEARILGAGKRLVLVLNKVDLVPRAVVAGWLTHLRREHPTLAFKANLQQQATRLGQAPEHFLLTKPDAVAQCVGAQPLMRLLAAFSRGAGGGGARATLTVGVVGLPNTGKSSLINSLKRERVCGAGSVPGLTRCAQLINLDKHVRMMDCPGVVLERARAGVSSAQLVLRNCLRPEDVEDPEPAVAEVLRHCPAQRLQLHYGLPPFTDTRDFLVKFARRCGMLLKGGRPDVVRSGRRLLHDWAQGRLVYYTEPPALPVESVTAGSQLKLIQEFSKEFDLNQMDETVLSESRPAADASTDMVIESFGTAALAPEDQVEEDDEASADEENMDENWTESEADSNEEAMSTDDEAPAAPGSITVLKDVELRVREPEVEEKKSLPKHLQQNRARRQSQKKSARKLRRAGLQQKNAGGDYDFEEDFLPAA